MRKKIAEAVTKIRYALWRAGNVLKEERGENYIDTVIKILIAVVLGALLLSGLYALYKGTVMPTLENRIQDMFNYAG